VLQAGVEVYRESTATTDLGVTPGQFADLHATLGQVPAGRFSPVWQTASQTGSWPYAVNDQNGNNAPRHRNLRGAWQPAPQAR
jgi:hypothetical protein